MADATPLDKEAWTKLFDELPTQKQDQLRLWFATQALIISELALAEDEWFGLIGWALEHPLDFSFLERLANGKSDDASVVEGDASKAKARGDAARAVGNQSTNNVASGDLAKQGKDGLQKELYQRFMNNRMNESGHRPKAPPKKK